MRQDKWTIRAITVGLTAQKLAAIQPRPPQRTLSRVERSDDRKIRQYERPSADPYPPEPATQLTDERSFHPCLAKEQRNRSRCVT
jgi:hypothetical protein